MAANFLPVLLGAASEVLGPVVKDIFDFRLSGAEREANAFTTSEREAAQNWSEEMYNKYQSPQAQITSQIQGYKDNGINPALMYGGTAPSAGSMPSVSGGHSVTPSSGSAGILSSIVDMMRVKNEQSRIKNDYEIAKTRNDIEDRRVSAIEELNPSRIESNLASAWRNITAGNLNSIDAETRSDMNNARIAVMYSQVDNNTSQALLARSGVNVNDAKVGLLVVQAVNQEIANKYADRYWQAELALKQAMTEGEYQKISYLQEEISFITTKALESAYQSDLISRYIDEKDLDIQYKGFKVNKQNVDWLFDKGIQTMNILNGTMAAGASLGRTIHYGRSVTAGLGAGAPAIDRTPTQVFNPPPEYYFN